MIIKVFNPYIEKEYVVEETSEYIEQSMHNVLAGNEDFILLHTKGGIPITVSPKNWAAIEVRGEGE